jgi:DNA invertase Pin-like site-specific DNA recombinase
MKPVAIYARVSTNKQETENQLIELRRYVEARGWPVFKEYVDDAVSTRKEMAKRPQLVEMMKAAHARKIGAVIVWRFDRFARSMRELITALDSFREMDVAFISQHEGIDTTTAQGRMVFGMIAAIAEFERELIKERIHLGLNGARARGQLLGRPRAPVNLDELRAFRSSNSLRKCAAKFGIGKDTVKNLLQVTVVPN